jgi:hypothetical protein
MKEKWAWVIPLLVAGLSFLGSIVIWTCDNRSARELELYKRKEEKYALLISSIKGFYASEASYEKKKEFIDQIDLCWMYCSDEVILACYAFIESVHKHNKNQQEANQVEKLGQLMLEIRKDLIRNRLIENTKLSEKNFKPLKIYR